MGTRSATPLHLKWIEIDRQALRSNLKTALCLLGPAKLMAVVKADAYGHGAEAVSRLALANGASCLGVLTLAEAVALREKGISGPIVLLAPPIPEQAERIVREKVEPTIDSLDLADALSRCVKGAPLPVHVDLDYGLGRWGLPPKELDDFLQALSKRKKLRLRGLSAHIDYVPGKNAVEAEEKLRDFHRRCEAARRLCPGVLCHAANTSILLDFPHWKMDMVRLGNLLYGINPTSKELPLKDPWSFHARIISLKDVAKGRPIGYASQYVAPRRMRVATLPAGYADGLTMEPADRLIRLGSGFQYWGMLRGQQAPFVGRCGIAHVLVDVSLISDARLGDAVILPVRRTAASSRVPRVYKN